MKGTAQVRIALTLRNVKRLKTPAALAAHSCFSLQWSIIDFGWKRLWLVARV